MLGLLALHVELADAQVAVLALPSTHRTYMRAWGGDADSWDLLIGFVPDPLSACSGSPVHVTASKGCWPSSEYFDDVCYRFFYDDDPDSPTSPYTILSYSTACVSDLSSYLDNLFQEAEYLRIDYFNDTSCSALDVANIVVADGNCHARHVAVNESASTVESRIAVVDASGAASLRKFSTANCSGEPTEDLVFTEAQVDSHECVDSAAAWVKGGGQSAGAIAGIVIAAVVVCLALVAGIVWWRRRKSRAYAVETETGKDAALEADYQGNNAY